MKIPTGGHFSAGFPAGEKLMKEENADKLGRIIQEFQENCDTEFLNIVNVFWERGADRNKDEVVYEIHVEIEDKENPVYSNTYCYPIADFGRERGLYLWDTVTDWMNGTITLRFRFEE